MWDFLIFSNLFPQLEDLCAFVCVCVCVCHFLPFLGFWPNVPGCSISHTPLLHIAHSQWLVGDDLSKKRTPPPPSPHQSHSFIFDNLPLNNTFPNFFWKLKNFSVISQISEIYMRKTQWFLQKNFAKFFVEKTTNKNKIK